VLLVKAGAKGLGETEIEKVVVPLTPTAHAMRIGCGGEKILFNTMYTALIVAVGTA
jgi:hypothetical protein